MFILKTIEYKNWHNIYELNIKLFNSLNDPVSHYCSLSSFQ